jgi:nuclear polyadenylated RNA-binding protein 3
MDGAIGSGSDSDYNPEDTLPSSVRPSSSLTETEFETEAEIEAEPQTTETNQTAAETDLSSETAPPSSAPPQQQEQVEHTSTSTDTSPPATEIAPAPSHTITKPKSVKFADHHTEIPNPALRSPSPEYSGSNNEASDDNDGDKSPSEPIRVIDDNTGTVEVIAPTNNTTPDDIDIDNDTDIDVPLFNEIVQYYIASSFFQNEDFNALPPAEKETLIISEYCKAKEIEVDPKRVNLNFHATTSYNKPVLKQNDQIQLLVPINPFCRRPDITQPMDTDERYEFEEFKKDSDKYSKEFECLDFPPGSRLFIGNLAVNSLKISDVWRIFKQYGAVKAVNMKQGYGFVQFADSRACHVAIQGEEHVPLHNKLTQLQVSKTHEKHTENKHDAEKERDKYSRDRQRERERERERSPKRANTNANGTGNGNGSVNRKVRVIISLDSDAGFNHLLVNSLNEVGLKCNVKHVDTPADSVPQEAISESAYAGVCATLVTSKYELVNLFLFQRNQKDGAIKFDEYENISMESAINFIMKQVTEAARERDRSRSHARDRDGDKNRDRERQRGRHGDRGPRDRDSRDGRFARHSGDRDRDRDRGHDRAWRDERTDRPVPTVNVSYSPTQQNEQKHLPPQITHPPPTAFSNLPTQPRARAQAQQQHPMPYYNAPVSQPQPQPQPPVNIASQLMNQLSSMDEASLKAMLQLVQSQGQGQGPPPPQNQGYPPPQGYPQQYPPAPAPMQPYPQQFPSPYPPQGYPAQGFAPQPQQPFSQMPSGSANGVGGLLAQLQGVPPGGLAPAPASAPAAPVPAVEDDEDSTSRLFETLARLKNNM